MALELYMLGLVVQDMGKSLQFYRQLGLDFPPGSESRSHVDVKMGNLTFFLDSKPARWDPWYVRKENAALAETSESYPSIMEFYLGKREAVTAKYGELTGLGYQSHRAPYETSFGMYFAMVKDPDGNIVLLSGDLRDSRAAAEA
jgi:predicted lactoylglutathione lyase